MDLSLKFLIPTNQELISKKSCEPHLFGCGIVRSKET